MVNYYVCEKCGRLLKETEFYSANNESGKMSQCKKCRTMHVDNWDPQTFLPILEEADVPYIKKEWDALLAKAVAKDPTKITGMSIIGKYFSKMKLRQWKDYHWADTERLKAEEEAAITQALEAQGYTEEEIQEELSKNHSPLRPQIMRLTDPTEEIPNREEEEEEEKYDLTAEDKTYLQLKWGKDYSIPEWIRLEQLYEEMMASYDIQGAGHKDYLILICKTSLKANQLIDQNDIEGFQKMSKVYDSLMKSSKFTAAQNKGESGNFVDSIGEIVAICEREGFIPRYYVDGPQDKVDRTLQDLQRYTKTLVAEEINLDQLVQSSLKEIAADREREASIDVDSDDDLNFEDKLFSEEDFDELRELDLELTEENEKVFSGEVD